jgi:hypothetical protein
MRSKNPYFQNAFEIVFLLLNLFGKCQFPFSPYLRSKMQYSKTGEE